MKMNRLFSFILLFIFLIPGNSFSQKKVAGLDVITSSDLSSFLNFLASPLLQGRKNGEAGLDIAQQYIVSEAKLLGLKPANGSSYLQPYYITSAKMDMEKTKIQVAGEAHDTLSFHDPILQIIPTGPTDFTIEGEVIFAGYGLKQAKYNYDDFENIQAEGKILLVMMNGPVNQDGKYVFDVDWKSQKGMQMKLTSLLFSKAKAILIVMDSKSGYKDIDDEFPGFSAEFTSSSSLKGGKTNTFSFSNFPKILMVSRAVADALLDGSGYTLDELQNKIDSGLKPNSFLLPDKYIKVTEAVKSQDIQMNNVAAFIEGRDPALKNEYVVFSCHADHLGVTSKGLNPGADDNASGCSALLSIAKAFMSLDNKPLRSILFLWFSGEEIGLYGSKTYISNPLIPLDKTVADLNIDMIGRTKGVADTTADHPMTGPGKVFVITDNQSKDLLQIADEADRNSELDLDYSLSGRNHPLQLFSRSDHYNFVKHDIPVMFFITGLHTDYHTPGDVIEKIDFNKLQLVTRTIYQIGYNVANRKTRITVDNPFSKWNK